MIYGFPLLPVIGQASGAEGVTIQAPGAVVEGGGFQSFLLSQVGSSTSTVSANTAGLSANRILYGSIDNPSNPKASLGLQEALKKLILSSPQVSAKPSLENLIGLVTEGSADLVPLNVNLDLAALGPQECNILEQLGLVADSQSPGLTILVGQKELEQLQALVSSSTNEFSLPVKVVLPVEGQGTTPELSVVEALLTVRPAAEAPSESSLESPVSEKLAPACYLLTLTVEEVPGDGSVQGGPVLPSGNRPPLSADKLLAGIIQAVGKLKELLGSETGVVISGNTDNAAPVIPVPDEVSLGEIVETQDPEPAAPQVETAPAAELLQDLTSVLIDLLRTSLEQARTGNDPTAAVSTLTLLDNLAHLEELPPAQQASTVSSLISELEKLLPAPHKLDVPQVQDQDDSAGGSSLPEALDLSELDTGTNPVIELTDKVPGGVGQTLPDSPLSSTLDKIITMLGQALDKIEDSSPVEGIAIKHSSTESPVRELEILSRSAAKLAALLEYLLQGEQTDGRIHAAVPESASGDSESTDRFSLLENLARIIAAQPADPEKPASDSPVPEGRTRQAPEVFPIPMPAPVAEIPVTAPDENPVAAAQWTAVPTVSGSRDGDTPPVQTGNPWPSPGNDVSLKQQTAGTTSSGLASAGISGKEAAPETIVQGTNPQPDSAPGKAPEGGSPRVLYSVIPNAPSAAGVKDAGPKLQAQSGETAQSILKISIPVQLVQESVKSSSQTGKNAQETVTVYAGQVQTGNSSKPSEQTSTQARPGQENAATPLALNGIIESIQGRQTGMDDRPGSSNNSDLFQQMRLEMAHQGLRSENGLFRLPAADSSEKGASGTTLLANQAEVIDKIVSTARLSQSGATSEISLRLEPEQLGAMRVRLSLSDQHTVSARIQVETVEAKALIENSLHRLRESFAEQGLKVEKFNVDVRQDQNSNNNEQQTAMGGKDAGHRGARKALSEFANLPGQYSMENYSPGPDKPSRYSPRSLGYNTVEWVA